MLQGRIAMYVGCGYGMGRSFASLFAPRGTHATPRVCNAVFAWTVILPLGIGCRRAICRARGIVKRETHGVFPWATAVSPRK